MKTNGLRKITCVCLLLMTFVAVGSARERSGKSKFYYDNLGTKTLADIQVVSVSDENDKYLEPHLKYHFGYDESGRMLKKEAFKWDDDKKGWLGYYRLNFTYSDDAMIVELVRWDRKKKEYKDCSERTIYKTNANMFTSYSHYKRNSSNGDWFLESTCLMDIPTQTLWTENAVFIAEINE